MTKNLPAPIDERQKKFLQILFRDDVKGNIETAKELAGWGPEVDIQSIMTKDFVKAIHEATDQYLALMMPQAARSIGDVLTSPNKPGNQQLLRAAESILDRQGLGKKETDSGPKVQFNAVLVIPKKQVMDDLSPDQIIIIDGKTG